MVTENQNNWQTESEHPWEPEVPKTPKQILMTFIIHEVKLGTPKDVLLNEKVPDFIIQNNLGKFKKSEASSMIDWAIKTFGSPDAYPSLILN